jgi:hypothetical protein
MVRFEKKTGGIWRGEKDRKFPIYSQTLAA